VYINEKIDLVSTCCKKANNIENIAGLLYSAIVNDYKKSSKTPENVVSSLVREKDKKIAEEKKVKEKENQ
ncbi:unnamed protein product, partial [marine sediment metagenome]